jgi:ketosteroid isomerase-like protein
VTSNARRAAVLVRALEASIVGDSQLVKDVYTADVKGWSPALHVSSAAELAVELEDRETAFTDIVLDVRPLDVSGDCACAEWTATATHSGPLVVDDDIVLEPTGRRCTFHGVTVAEFDGDRIRSFRQYWDEAEALAGLGLLPAD